MWRDPAVHRGTEGGGRRLVERLLQQTPGARPVDEDSSGGRRAGRGAPIGRRRAGDAARRRRHTRRGKPPDRVPAVRPGNAPWRAPPTPVGCRGGRPAAARQDRRPGGRSPRPGSRACRCGVCPSVAAARGGCRRRSRDGRSNAGRPRSGPASPRVPRRSPGGQRLARWCRTSPATTSRTMLPGRCLPSLWRPRPGGQEVVARAGW